MQAIRNDFKASKFIAYVEGQIAGSLHYRIKDGQMWLLEVDVDRRCQDVDLASQLIQEALGEACHRRLAVLPLCNEARSHILAHPRFLRLVPSERRQRLGKYVPGLRKRARGRGGAPRMVSRSGVAAGSRPEEGGKAA
jgi:predicted GNAT family acetyltransferase